MSPDHAAEFLMSACDEELSWHHIGYLQADTCWTVSAEAIIILDLPTDNMMLM